MTRHIEVIQQTLDRQPDELEAMLAWIRLELRKAEQEVTR